MSEITKPLLRTTARFFPCLVLVLLDQLTKYLAVLYLDFIPLSVMPMVSLTLACNTGAAFSLFEGASGILLLVGIGFSIFLGVLLYHTQSASKLQRLAYATILAGAIGNVIDRIFRGCVVDFIHLHAGNYHFPIFNFADTVISVGAALWIWCLLTEKVKDAVPTQDASNRSKE